MIYRTNDRGLTMSLELKVLEDEINAMPTNTDIQKAKQFERRAEWWEMFQRQGFEKDTRGMRSNCLDCAAAFYKRHADSLTQKSISLWK